MGDSSALFRINPETGSTTHFGDTGLESAEVGLTDLGAGGIAAKYLLIRANDLF